MYRRYETGQGDIALLAGFFAERFRRKLGLQQLILSASAIDMLESLSLAWKCT